MFRLRVVCGWGRQWDAGGTHVVMACQAVRRPGTSITERFGRAVRYRLNREHLAAGPMIALAGQRDELLRRTSALLEAWTPSPACASLFGSAARGDMGLHSDIDLLVVRPVGEDDDTGWEEQVRDLAARVSRWTGNDARVLELTETEVREAVADADPVLDRR